MKIYKCNALINYKTFSGLTILAYDKEEIKDALSRIFNIPKLDIEVEMYREVNSNNIRPNDLSLHDNVLLFKEQFKDLIKNGVIDALLGQYTNEELYKLMDKVQKLISKRNREDSTNE